MQKVLSSHYYDELFLVLAEGFLVHAGSVSWTDKPVSYYLHVIDSTKLERYFNRQQSHHTRSRSEPIQRWAPITAIRLPANELSLLARITLHFGTDKVYPCALKFKFKLTTEYATTSKFG